MAFAAVRPTDDRFSPKPDGFGWSRVTFTITNTGGSTGGTIPSVPFRDADGISISRWTPTTSGSYPSITSAAINATTGLVDVVMVFPADMDGELELCGRGM